MNKKTDFPVAPSLAAAPKMFQCINCCPMESLGAPVESGYPAGRGHWRMPCGSCGASIWFDLAPDTPVDHLAPMREMMLHFEPRGQR